MRPATPDDKSNAKIALLNKEIDEIHHANSLYWKQGQRHIPVANAQHQSRQDRLDKIREELATLQGQVPMG